MKYGVLFLTLSLLLAFYAFTTGGWFLLLAWPAISFGVIGLAYLTLGHRVFGKRTDGSMAFASVAILLPYLLYLWAVWHIIRLVSREPAYNTLTDGVLIGRRPSFRANFLLVREPLLTSRPSSPNLQHCDLSPITSLHQCLTLPCYHHNPWLILPLKLQRPKRPCLSTAHRVMVALDWWPHFFFWHAAMPTTLTLRSE